MKLTLPCGKMAFFVVINNFKFLHGRHTLFYSMHCLDKTPMPICLTPLHILSSDIVPGFIFFLLLHRQSLSWEKLGSLS